ncbi:MAG: hypothetical protein ACI8W7_002509 [Gammaproteobacteria bacterium]|jgi:hypothetical protein
MTERDNLKALDRNARRYLDKIECSWCGHNMNTPGCSAIYGMDNCTEDSRQARQVEALKAYLPRGVGG